MFGEGEREGGLLKALPLSGNEATD